MTEKDIAVPRWVVILIFGLFLNLGAIVFGAGILYSQVQDLQRRMGNVENQLLILIGR